jgi:outer membrane murein-binding lipoprotein Lpp
VETLVKQLRAAKKAAGYTAVPVKLAGLLDDAASRIEDLEDHVDRLEDRLATAYNDIKGLRGRPHRDG